MAKQVYASNEQEMKEMAEARDLFEFDKPREAPKVVILVAGPEGSGKTHLACTMSELGPVYLFDTEYRADIVVRKFKGAVKFKTVRTYKDMVVAIKGTLKKHPPGTFVIDSCSDLQVFAEIAYLERTKAEKIYPVWNWSEVWAMCNALIDDIKASGNNLVVTTRVKEEYVAEKPTGRWVPRIYSVLPYKSDVSIQFPREPGKPGFLIKNGFTGDLTPEVPRKASLPELIKSLST